MKYLAVLLLGAVCIQENSAFFGKPWARDSLRVKYTPLIFNGFFEAPKNSNSKLLKDYVKIDDAAASLSVPGDVYCPKDDPRFCVIFDKKGVLVGSRSSFLVEDVKDVKGYDLGSINSLIKTEMFPGQSAYTLDVFYFDPATITEEGVGEKSEVAEGLWAKIHGETVHLPANDPKIENYNGFQRQACFPQMGQHYFYGLNKTETDCSQHAPFFGLYHNGGLVGHGFATYGKSSVAETEGARDWYESVPLLGARLIMPNRPQCVDDLITQNGLYSTHVYFVNTPALIGCLFQ